MVTWWQVATGLNAVIAAYLLIVLRGRRGAVLARAGLPADVAAERRRAVEANDDVVQGLTTVLYALELDAPDLAAAAAQQALADSRRILAELLAADGSALPLGAGDLRRHPAPPSAQVRE